MNVARVIRETSRRIDSDNARAFRELEGWYYSLAVAPWMRDDVEDMLEPQNQWEEQVKQLIY